MEADGEAKGRIGVEVKPEEAEAEVKELTSNPVVEETAEMMEDEREGVVEGGPRWGTKPSS